MADDKHGLGLPYRKVTDVRLRKITDIGTEDADPTIQNCEVEGDTTAMTKVSGATVALGDFCIVAQNVGWLTEDNDVRIHLPAADYTSEGWYPISGGSN